MPRHLLSGRRFMASWLLFAAFGGIARSPADAQALAIDVRTRGGDPVADAVVFALPESPSPPRGSRTAIIEQRDREFEPWVSVIQTGTTVSFPNRDPILHHVYSFSPAKPFEIKLYSGESPHGVVFNKPGIVTLGCNIHDWMIGYVAVVDTPFYGKSGKEGRVVLSQLPAGRYQLRAWHPLQKAETEAQSVDMPATGSVRAGFIFDLSPRKTRYKPPLDKMKY